MKLCSVLMKILNVLNEPEIGDENENNKKSDKQQ